MECRNVRELADSFLSGQLLVETNHELVRHLERCPDCRDDMTARRALRERLRSAVLNSPSLQPRPEFASELTAVLRPRQAGVTRRQLLSTWWAAAAGLAVAAGGGVVYLRSRRLSRASLVTLARRAAGDHQNCAVRFNLAERPISLDAAGGLYGEPFAKLARFDLPALDRPARLVDRHSCVYDGQRFAHVVFRIDETLMSLLVTTDPRPSVAALEPVPGGPDVAALPAGPYLAFVVGEADPDRLLRVARALVDPLARHLV
jgi:anti-sigma factor RsiW